MVIASLSLHYILAYKRLPMNTLLLDSRKYLYQHGRDGTLVRLLFFQM